MNDPNRHSSTARCCSTILVDAKPVIARVPRSDGPGSARHDIAVREADERQRRVSIASEATDAAAHRILLHRRHPLGWQFEVSSSRPGCPGPGLLFSAPPKRPACGSASAKAVSAGAMSSALYVHAPHGRCASCPHRRGGAARTRPSRAPPSPSPITNAPRNFSTTTPTRWCPTGRCARIGCPAIGSGTATRRRADSSSSSLTRRRPPGPRPSITPPSRQRWPRRWANRRPPIACRFSRSRSAPTRSRSRSTPI